MAFDRDKTYYVQKEWKGFSPGMELDTKGYSDHKLELFLEEGTIGFTAPDTDKAEELVPPVNTGDPVIDAADASLEPNRRSREATGQPDPPDEAKAIREATGAEAADGEDKPKRGRPANNP